jgi:pyruvyltransferase
MKDYSVIPTYYHRSINFGDMLSPYILEKMSGKQCVYQEQTKDITTIMAIGSILGTDVSNSVIWGNGFAWKYNETEVVTKPLDICAVRGKLTRTKLIENGIDCPEVYGDPALLLPKFYLPKIKKKYKLGIIPHIVDYDDVCKHYEGILPEDVTIIDLRLLITDNTIESVIEKILECKKTISGSLHGLIVSNAYGVDSLWVEFSKKIQGDGFKFWDYFSCTDVTPYLPINPLESDESLESIISKIPKCKITADLDLLYNSCPVLSVKNNA